MASKVAFGDLSSMQAGVDASKCTGSKVLSFVMQASELMITESCFLQGGLWPARFGFASSAAARHLVFAQHG